MFWVGFNSVFLFLANAFYGLLTFSALGFGIVALLYLYEVIIKVGKKLSDKSNLQNGVLHDKNVIVTGGSSGIGKCVAILAAQSGANVTIIARNAEKLKLARDEIVEACRNKNGQKVECIPLDVSQDYERVERVFNDLQEKQGPCYMLVNCAGTAICGKIEDTSEVDLRCMVDLNLLGTYFSTKAVIPAMKQAKEGKIVLVASQAALLGIYGYSAYCSSKFALKGLAESLAMELAAYNVSVTLSLPPDTDTPGLAIEEQTKPLETKLISASAGLMQPEAVAQQLLNDTMDGKFFSFIGMESFILTTLCSGMSPYSSFGQLILQALLMGPLKLISAFYLYSFKKIVLRCKEEREKMKKSE